MEDRFKVRIWDVAKREYITDIPMRDSKYLLQIFLGLDGKIYVDWPDDDLDELTPEYFLREQCTGVKDKNGNLVFEGDIVRETELVIQIKWLEKLAAWGGRIDQVTILMHRVMEPRREIMGNIHENADLLKRKGVT